MRADIKRIKLLFRAKTQPSAAIKEEINDSMTHHRGR
jgi:hypothetical protein